jgi:hypothetical protein
MQWCAPSTSRMPRARCAFACSAPTERQRELAVTLNLPGLHNVQNALAAIAVATEVGVSDAAIQKALCRVPGRRPPLPALRRSAAARRGRPAGSFTLVDDYGHHPAEMAATLAAARGAFPGRRLVLAFQPHRYTRTRDLFEDFVKVLSTVDAAAGRGVRGRRGAHRRRRRSLARACGARGRARSSPCSSRRSEMPEAIRPRRATGTSWSPWARVHRRVPWQLAAARRVRRGMRHDRTPHLPSHGLRGAMRENEPMRRHVSWRAGGAARRAYVPGRSRRPRACSCVRCRPTSRCASLDWAATCWCAMAAMRGTVVLMHGALGADRDDSGRRPVQAEAGWSSPRWRASPRCTD